MKETRKFPGGYDVTICRKKDVLDCIDQNIIDKDIALAIVEHCEYAAADYIKDGVWSSIPFIGNIRKSKIKEMKSSEETKALIEEAKENLDREKYLLFRQRLNKEYSTQIAVDRYYRYMTSIAVNKNKKLFKRLCKERGEVYARLFLFCSYEVTSLDNQYIRLSDYEL